MTKIGRSILALLNDVVYRYGDYDKMAIAMTLGLDSFFREKFTSLVSRPGRCTVLDLGSGTGRNVPFLLRHNSSTRIVLLDLSIHGLRRAKERFQQHVQVDLVCASAELLPLRCSSIHAAVSSYMLRQVRTCILARELRRVLRGDGIAVIVDFWRSTSALRTTLLLTYLAVIVPLEALMLCPTSWHAYRRLWRELIRLPPPTQVSELFSRYFRRVKLFTFNNFVFLWVLSR